MDPSLNQDQSLFVRIKGGDERAFKHLFLKYYTKLRNYSVFLLKNNFEAEEAVSDVFFKIWQTRAKIDASTNLRAYLFMAVRNQSLNYLRDNPVKLAKLSEVSSHSSFNIEDDLYYLEYEQQVSAIVNKMSGRQREVFQMSRFYALSYEEIATILSISIHTVQEHMVNALKHLRKCIRDQALFD